jgi:hypothetical protein
MNKPRLTGQALWEDFLRDIMVICEPEELDDLCEAIREDMRKGNRTNGHLLLEELRARKATKH